MAGIHQFFPDELVRMPRVRSRTRHDKTGPSLFIQIRIKILYPQIVGIAEGMGLFIDSRQSKGETRIIFHLFGIHAIHIEWRICHHKIACSREFIVIFIKCVFLGNVNLQTMHRKVHQCQTGIGFGFFLAVEGHFFCGLFPLTFNEIAGLDKHAATAAGRVKHRPVIRLNDIHNGLHQRNRREKLSALLRAGHGEFVQKILINSPENISGRCLQCLTVKYP